MNQITNYTDQKSFVNPVFSKSSFTSLALSLDQHALY